MNRAAAVVLILSAIVCVHAPAGDIKVVLIEHYEHPGWTTADKTVAPDLASKIEIKLEGTAGVALLRQRGCENLANICSAINGSGAATYLIARLASLREETLWVYLIDDREGLTETMRDYAGICDYAEVGDASGKRYAWLCGHVKPERAIKIGEHFAQKYREAAKRNGIALRGEQEGDGSALIAAFIAELINTVIDAEWQPNDAFLKSGDVNPASVVDQTFNLQPTTAGDKPASTRQAPNYAYQLTLASSRAAALRRGLELFLATSCSPIQRSTYETFAGIVGLMSVREGTETYVSLAGKADVANVSPGHDGFLWSSIPLEKLVDNEVFIGLFLRHYTPLQPPIKDVFGDDMLAGDQILNYVATNREAIAGLQDILSHLMENFAKAVSNDAAQIREQRLFMIALIDLLGGYRSERGMFEALFSITVIPESETKAVMDAYFGGAGSAGLREACRRASAGGTSLEDKRNELATRFNRNQYDVHKTP